MIGVALTRHHGVVEEVNFAPLPALSEEVTWLAQFRDQDLGKDLSVP